MTKLPNKQKKNNNKKRNNKQKQQPKNEIYDATHIAIHIQT